MRPCRCSPCRPCCFRGGWLPLQIFEVRYLDMIGQCHREGRPFGVVSLLQGQEVQRAGDSAPEAFQPVGTLAHIVSLERPRPGLLYIRCEGGQRFRLTTPQRLKHGLWVAPVAEWLPGDPSVAVPDHLLHVQRALQDLVAQGEAEVARQPQAGLELPVRQPYRWHDAGWLANRWCEVLGLPPARLQQLMSLENPLLRLELVADLLERDHGLAPPAGD